MAMCPSGNTRTGVSRSATTAEPQISTKTTFLMRMNDSKKLKATVQSSQVCVGHPVFLSTETVY